MYKKVKSCRIFNCVQLNIDLPVYSETVTSIITCIIFVFCFYVVLCTMNWQTMCILINRWQALCCLTSLSSVRRANTRQKCRNCKKSWRRTCWLSRRSCNMFNNRPCWRKLKILLKRPRSELLNVVSQKLHNLSATNWNNFMEYAWIIQSSVPKFENEVWFLVTFIPPSLKKHKSLL